MPDMNIVMVGHVDHGKSTIVGRLMADTDSLPNGKIESVKEKCKSQSKKFEYAYLIDVLHDEQAQGITIDTARCFFKTNKRNYMIFDAPGHVEFIRNMVTGASMADVALLVIDVVEGIKDNSRRHGYLLSILGIKQIIVLINKMDLVNFSQQEYDSVKRAYEQFMHQINLEPIAYIPVSGACGDNIVIKSCNMPWYSDLSLLQMIESFETPQKNIDRAFRMPVQDVYKFTSNGDSRRIIAGTVISGKAKCGDRISFFPSGKSGIIKTIESFNKDIYEANTGFACGLTLSNEIFVKRGEIAFLQEETCPICTDSVQVKLFWLDKTPLLKGKKYIMKIGPAKVYAVLSNINKVIDANTLEERNDALELQKNQIGECIFLLEQQIALDINIIETLRFVLVDDYEICGGGYILPIHNIVQRDTEYKQVNLSSAVVTISDRIMRNGHRPWLVLVIGENELFGSIVSKKVEKNLFDAGIYTYYLELNNLPIFLKFSDREEKNIKEMVKIIAFLLSAGMVAICNLSRLVYQEIVQFIECGNRNEITTVFIGNNSSTSDKYDLYVEEMNLDVSKVVETIKKSINNRLG